MSDNSDRMFGAYDVKAVLEETFKGCRVKVTPSMGGSLHAEMAFDEYEIRVIMSGRVGEPKKIHYRFLQKVKRPGTVKSTKVFLNEIHTQDPQELMKAIRDAKEYLLGIVHAINKALRRPTVPQVREIDDLLNRE